MLSSYKSVNFYYHFYVTRLLLLLLKTLLYKNYIRIVKNEIIWKQKTLKAIRKPSRLVLQLRYYIFIKIIKNKNLIKREIIINFTKKKS